MPGMNQIARSVCWPLSVLDFSPLFILLLVFFLFFCFVHVIGLEQTTTFPLTSAHGLAEMGGTGNTILDWTI